jgi:hypothetical protein
MSDTYSIFNIKIQTLNGVTELYIKAAIIDDAIQYASACVLNTYDKVMSITPFEPPIVTKLTIQDLKQVKAREYASYHQQQSVYHQGIYTVGQPSS